MSNSYPGTATNETADYEYCTVTCGLAAVMIANRFGQVSKPPLTIAKYRLARRITTSLSVLVSI